jgi:flagellar biosynthesis protein FliR
MKISDLGFGLKMVMKTCEENPRALTEFNSEFAVLNILYSITSVSAIFLNVLVIVTVWKTPSLHTPSRILLCSLAMSNFLLGALIQTVASFYFVALQEVESNSLYNLKSRSSISDYFSSDQY